MEWLAPWKERWIWPLKESLKILFQKQEFNRSSKKPKQVQHNPTHRTVKCSELMHKQRMSTGYVCIYIIDWLSLVLCWLHMIKSTGSEKIPRIFEYVKYDESSFKLEGNKNQCLKIASGLNRLMTGVSERIRVSHVIVLNLLNWK